MSGGAEVDYKIDLTVNKGTPIQAGDIIEIPVKADHGNLYESHGLSVLDSEDGSLLGEATITKDKIRIKITQQNHTKTAAKLSILTTLKSVTSDFVGSFPTQAEVDAAYAAHPTGIVKVKILDKNVNVNMKLLGEYFCKVLQKLSGTRRRSGCLLFEEQFERRTDFAHKHEYLLEHSVEQDKLHI